MSDLKPTVVFVHGAFAESASWNGVIAALYAEGVTSVAVANPLRSLAGDAAYVRDVIASIDGPVVLVGHSYGGLVISEASAGNDQVVGLVYAGAFVPEPGDSAFSLSASEPGSTLGDALDAHPISTGGIEFVIRRPLFRDQFAADVPVQVAGLMGALTRRRTGSCGDRWHACGVGDQFRAARGWWTCGGRVRTVGETARRAAQRAAAAAHAASSRGASTP